MKKSVYTFILALNFFQRRKFMAFTLDKNNEQFTRQFTYILSNKDRFYKASQTFLWKTRSSRSQLLLRKPVLLKIIEYFQKNIGGGVRFQFISLVCCYVVKIDVLLEKIFHNLQTSNYMTSPVSISLNILRICEECQVAF